MNKRKILVLVILLLSILFPFGCKPKKDIIKVTASTDAVTIKDIEIGTYDFKNLFTILKNEEKVDVEDSFIDRGNLSATPGTYQITCTYNNVSASVNVTV